MIELDSGTRTQKQNSKPAVRFNKGIKVENDQTKGARNGGYKK